MFFILTASIWHGALEIGGTARIKKDTKGVFDWFDPDKKFLSIMPGIECGKRIFFCDSTWFLNPVLHHVHTFNDLTTFALELRLGKILTSRFSLSGLVGVAFVLLFDPNVEPVNMHIVTGACASFKITDNLSLTSRVYHKSGYTKLVEKSPFFDLYFKDTHHLVFTVGVEAHRMGFYGEPLLASSCN